MCKDDSDLVGRVISYRDPFEKQYLDIAIGYADQIDWQSQRIKDYTRDYKIRWV